jgi:predicted Fe-S protein YdhL (DUF1289 family)
MDSELYTLTNKYKKCSLENDYFTKYIMGKKVTLIITTIFRWGEFEVNLTDEEKKNIMSKDTICLNDYDFCFVSNIDGCERIEEIENLESYTEEEKRAIYNDIYEDDDNEVLLNSMELEDNDWELYDTIYEIEGEIELTL